MRRFLLRVLPPHFVKVRHYGLYASGNVNHRLRKGTKGAAAAEVSEVTEVTEVVSEVSEEESGDADQEPTVATEDVQ